MSAVGRFRCLRLTRSLLQHSVDVLPLSARVRIKRISGVVRLQRWLLGRYLDGTTFIHTVTAGPARGVRFRVTLPEDKGIWTGTYEPAFAAAMSHAVRPTDVCFDIGGFHGYMAATLAAAGAAHVAVFEPNPANFRNLQELARLNPQFRLSLYAFAVGAQDGEAQFSLMAEASMGKLQDSTFQAGASALMTLTVVVRRIDDLVATGEVPPPALMKIDVEGAELDVLRGAVETIRRHKPLIFLEVHSAALMQECEALLATLDYSLRTLDPALASRFPKHFVAQPHRS